MTVADPAPLRDLRERAARLRALALRLEGLADARPLATDSEGADWRDIFRGDWRNLRSSALDEIQAYGWDDAVGAHATLAVLDAVEGRSADMRAHLTVPGVPRHCAAVARSIAATAGADVAAAIDELIAVLASASALPDDDRRILLGLLGDLAWATRRREDAARLVTTMEPDPAPISRFMPPLAREVAFARAMLVSPDPERDLVALIGVEPRTSFLGMRLSLAHGMLMRRTRRSRASRPMLQIALDGAVAMRAAGWEVRARGEMHAASAAYAGAGAGRLASLSAQELRIARLAARGLSNAAIAVELSLSPRTVSSHLYRIFPKLSIGSRVELVGLILSADRELR
jgi:DNA-binding CsgD family transcriptional regulator